MRDIRINLIQGKEKVVPVDGEFELASSSQLITNDWKDGGKFEKIQGKFDISIFELAGGTS